MAFTADFEKFRFPGELAAAFKGKRVFVTGSGKDHGIGQALILAAAANGAASVGVHFHSSYHDCFDFVAALRAKGVKAFAVQADVNNTRDLWTARHYMIDHMEGNAPDLVICNSGVTEKGYRFGRALPEKEGESRAERRARVRQEYLDNISESALVMNTKIQGYVAMTHLWAAEALYRNRPLQMIYISSMQAIEPGVMVPGYVVANWAVLRLPEVLKVNLGRSANLVSAACLMLPFVRTGMTEEYASNAKVFGRWQPRMLEPCEAAHSVTQLLCRPADELNLGNFKLGVAGTPEEVQLTWSRIRLEPREESLGWSAERPLRLTGAVRA